VCAALLADIPGDAESRQLRQLFAAGGVRQVLTHLLGEATESLVAGIDELLPQVRARFARHSSGCR